MASPFEIATKIAIKEMVENHSSKSKFGVFMTEENINTLVAELFQLVLTSRSLKANGDRIISGMSASPNVKVN